MDDIKSLSHSKWRCKYHIVFAPKYRRQVVYGKIKADVGKILRELSEKKGVEIVAAEVIPSKRGSLKEIYANDIKPSVNSIELSFAAW